jgi:hypothetical protein
MRYGGQVGKDRGISRGQLTVLGFVARNDAVAHDKASRNQEWLLQRGYLRAQIEHPPGSEWPRVVLKITDRGREALRAEHDRAAYFRP